MSLRPGAWTGKLLHTNSPQPIKAVLHEKWVQFQGELIDLVKKGHSAEPMIDHMALLSLTGRGMKQTEVYTDVKPHFKSFCNALEAWRENRDSEG